MFEHHVRSGLSCDMQGDGVSRKGAEAQRKASGAESESSHLIHEVVRGSATEFTEVPEKRSLENR